MYFILFFIRACKSILGGKNVLQEGTVDMLTVSNCLIILLLLEPLIIIIIIIIVVTVVIINIIIIVKLFKTLVFA